MCLTVAVLASGSRARMSLDTTDDSAVASAPGGEAAAEPALAGVAAGVGADGDGPPGPGGRPNELPHAASASASETFATTGRIMRGRYHARVRPAPRRRTWSCRRGTRRCRAAPGC